MFAEHVGDGMALFDYLLVGAGLFNSVFANLAHLSGKSCLVVEKRRHIAGNIYTEEIEGIPVHKYGAHIFHTSNEEVWRYINRFASFNNFINAPLANYKGKLFNLPFNMNTFYALWGVRTPAEALAKIEEQRAIANVLDAISTNIELLQNEVKAMEGKKKALMQLLLTGLVRVNA